MRRILIAIGIMLAIPLAYAQTRLNNYQPGPRLIDGSQLNLMVAAVNNLQGTGTPGAVTGTTGTFSGALSAATLSINSNSCTMSVTYATGGAALASNADSAFFVAPRAVRVTAISEVHAVAAGGASVVQVTKDSTTAAPGAGTDLLTNNTNTGFDLNATANTVQVGTLVATAGVTTLAVGDRLSVDYAQAVQSSVGVVITVCLAPI